MKSFMLLLALGLVLSEKLDRTYLPPPGSIYSGGSPGDLDVPLEFPRESYTTTAPSKSGQGTLSPEDTRLTVGTDRVGARIPGQSNDLIPVTPSTIPPSNYYSKVPTTTTSYAFTQTTTFPPSEGFETTINPITGLPFEGSEVPGFIKPSNQGQFIDQQRVQVPAGFSQPGSQIGQRPLVTSTPGVPSSQTIFPGSQTTIDGRPAYNQNFNQYQQTLPSSTVSPIQGRPDNYPQNVNQYQQTVPSTIGTPVLGNNLQPVIPNLQNQDFTHHLGVQPPHQFIHQFPSTTVAPGYGTNLPSSLPTVTTQGLPSSYQPGISSTQYSFDQGNLPQTIAGVGYPAAGPPSQFNNFGNVNIPGNLPSSNVSEQFGQVQQAGQRPIQIIGQSGQPSVFPTIVPQTTQYVDQYGNIQSIPSGTSIPQQIGQGQQFTGLVTPSSVRPQGFDNQQIPFQQGSNQYSTSNLLTPQQQGNQTPQSIGQQGYVQSTVSPQGLVPGGYQGLVPSSITSQSTFRPGNIPVQGLQNSQLFGQQVNPTGFPQGTVIPGSTLLQQNPQGTTSPGFIQQGGQYSQGTSQQGPLSSTVSPQGYPSIYRPESTPAGIFDSNQGRYIPGTNISQIVPGQQTQLLQGDKSSIPQLIPQQNLQTISPFRPDGAQKSQQTSTSRPVDVTNIYQPGSTFPSFIPLDQNGTVSPTSPSFPTYATTPGPFVSTTPGYQNIVNQGKVPITIQSGAPVNIQPRPDRPQAESDRNAVIINYDNNLENFPNEFAYSFDTSNGIHADENGTAFDGVKADGSYSYIGDDGRFYKVVYTADENGFQPQGDHLPTPPPVPQAIQRVIDQAEKDKEAGISHDGFYDEAKYGHKKYQKSKHRRPQTQNGIIANGADIPDEYENKIKDVTDNEERIPSGRRPISGVVDTDNETPDETEKNYLDKQGSTKYSPGGPLKNRRPNHDGYNQESKSGDKGHSRVSVRPKGSKPDTADRFISIKENSQKRPTNVEQYTPDKDRYEDETEEEEDVAQDSDDFRNVPSEKFGQGKILSTKASGVRKYNENDNESQTTPNRLNMRKQNLPESAQSVKRPGSGINYKDDSHTPSQSFDINGRPLRPVTQPSQKTETKYSVPNNNIEYNREFGFQPTSDDGGIERVPDRRYKVTNRPSELSEGRRPVAVSQDGQGTIDGIGFKQDSQPTFNKQTQITNGKKIYPQQHIDEETGYYYTPPQDKLEQTKGKFPTRFQENAKPTTKRPTNYENFEKQTTVRPFMTPNVYSEQEGSYEKVSRENVYSVKQGNGQTIEPEIDYELLDNSSEYFDETTSNQDIGDKIKTSAGGRPKKPGLKSPSHRPSFTQQTRKPEYVDYETNREDSETLRPGQANKYLPNSRRPDQSTSRTPGYNAVSSTTPKTMRKPASGSKRPQITDQQSFSNYPTTYEPTDTTEEDYIEGTSRPGFTITSSKKPVNRTISYPGSVSTISATSRLPSSRPTSPGYDYSDVTTIPGSSPTFESPTGSSYLPTDLPISGTNTPGKSNRPGYNRIQSGRPTSAPIDGYFTVPGATNTPGALIPGRTKYPESISTSSVTSIPGQTTLIPGQIGLQNIPSTTYRPYYPTGILQPGVTTTDGYVRPGSRDNTKIPGFISTQSTGMPTSASDKDSGITPSQIPFKPSDFKQSEPGIAQSYDSRLPGKKPVEFGPSSMKTPAYLSPYPSSTERITGEDFTGPKQPQRFDPDTGYHY